jgi:hypothetical protein
VTDVQLPHKLSELAQIALDDLTTKLEPRGIRVDLNYWCRLERRPQPSCTVCAAGAVMVSRLGLDVARGQSFGHGWLIEMFGEHNALALVAIDSLRQGQVGVALETLETQTFKPWQQAPDCEFDDDGESDPEAWHGEDGHALSRRMPEEYCAEWRDGMAQLISDLREDGL